MIFKETENSDNRMRTLDDIFNEEIIIGGNTTQVFHLWFNFEDFIESGADTYCQIIYRQGFDVILELDYTDSEVTVESFESDSSYLTVTLTPEETILFDDTVLDTYVQIKFKGIDGFIQYTNPIKLKVIKPLDQVNLV